MLHNFAYLIETYGHVPNGNRTYYLSRSQPPVFALMIELAEAHDVGRCLDHLPQLRQEHAYWMAGSEDLAPGNAFRRVLRLTDGALLNRYWDDRDTPREESWLEDVTTARALPARAGGAVSQHSRAACESGWDFSSRWLGEAAPAKIAETADGETADPNPPRADSAISLTSICTTDIVPVDLNAFLYKLECKIAQLAAEQNDAAVADEFNAAAQARKQAMDALLWDSGHGAYFDYDWRLARRRSGLNAACVTPLFVGMANAQQAQGVARAIESRLLAPGGLSATECWSDQQWDRPNGWAPLQWMAVCGLADYGHHALSKTIAKRWLSTVAELYRRRGQAGGRNMRCGGSSATAPRAGAGASIRCRTASAGPTASPRHCWRGIRRTTRIRRWRLRLGLRSLRSHREDGRRQRIRLLSLPHHLA